MLKMPVDARKVTEATGGVLDSTSKRVKEHIKMEVGNISGKKAIVANQNIKERDYWFSKLSGELARCTFPPDYQQKVNKLHADEPLFACLNFSFPGHLYTRLNTVSKGSHHTLHIFLVAGLVLLLNKYTGNKDIVVGTPIFKQDIDAQFINTVLAIRNQLDGDLTFKELLLLVRQTILEASENQDYPIEILSEQLNIPDSNNGFPLFDVVILNEDIHDKKYILHIDTSIIFSFKRNQQCVEGKIEYNHLLYKTKTIKNISSHFSQLLDNALCDLDEEISSLTMLTKEEKKQLLVDFNTTAVPYSNGKAIHQSFEEQAGKTPWHTALVFDGNVLSYRDLDQRVNQLSRILRKNGVTAETVVGIMMEPSLQMIFALLGILKAGGAYLPIDPELPTDRILYMLDDSGARVLLSNSSELKGIPFTTLQNLPSHHTDQVAVTKPRESIKDFDGLPIPDRSLINLGNYKGKIGMASVTDCISIQATRGCPYKCLYCHKVWSKNHAYRSAENIYQEIEYYYNKGVTNFEFIDDCFNLNRDNSIRLFNRIIKEQLKIRFFFPNGLRGDILTSDYIDLMVEAGTRGINLSLETASPRLQNLIKKNLDIERFKKAIHYIAQSHPEVMLEIAAMHGFPSETEEEALMTLNFIKEIHWVHFPYIHILKIYPDTEMEELALEYGVSREAIRVSKGLAYHELPETLPFPKSFTRKYQSDLLNEYFLSKERLKKVLPVQMKILGKDALVQKYNGYLPFEVKGIADIQEFARLDPGGITGGNTTTATFKGSVFASESEQEPTLKMSKKKKSPAKKILFLDLSQHFSTHSMLYRVSQQPLGLIYLLTYLKQEFKDRIDGRIYKAGNDFDSFEQLRVIVDDYEPDLIGIRTLTFFKEFFHETVSLLKQWGTTAPIITGGPYATSDYENLLEDKHIDLAILGEGEYTLAGLIKEMLKKDFKIPGTDILRNINGIAFKHMAGQDKSREVICQDRLKGYPSELDSSNPGCVTTGNNLAYVMYTSGSTGKPKGVMVENRQVNNCIHWMQDKFNLNEKDVIAQRTTLTFDPSVWEIFWPLSVGAAVRIIPKDRQKDADFLIDLMVNNSNLAMMYCPSTLVKVMTYLLNTKSPKPVLRLTWLIIGAEPINRDVVKNFYSYFEGNIINTYGPTECTINNTYYDISPDDKRSIVPIGKPVSNNKIYILSNDLQPVPVNMMGEICIAGASVGRGYINNPEKTEENFIRNPFAEGRLYRTGDLGRWLEDGNIEIMGRVDDQVKIRGYRIEPGEIKTALLRHPAIKDCVVLVRSQEPPVEEQVLACNICGITTRYPGIDIKDETCNICRDFEQYQNTFDQYFSTLGKLEQLIREANKESKGKYHCLILYSGGRGAAYALYQLKDMGLNILAATYDHGYFSKKDLQNVHNITASLGVDHLVLTHNHTDQILRESIRNAYTVCRGCFNTSSFLASRYAYENDIPVVVGATLSRGQIIENKLFMALQQGISRVEELEKEILHLRNNVMEIDKNIFDFIDIDGTRGRLPGEKVKLVDFYRYCNITNQEMVAYLNHRDPYWKTRKNYAIYSTNCPIKQLGDYGYLQVGRGHFYGSATSWEKRLGHLTLENVAEDLKCHITQKGYENFLKRIGYPIRRDNRSQETKQARQEDKYLCAYITAQHPLAVTELREYLDGELPNYMIPSHFVLLEEIPLLSNGKVNRRALPQLEIKPAGNYTGPRSQVERELVEIWSEVLDVTKDIIGIDANFFQLGGHSLRATIMEAKIHKQLDVKIPLPEIFKSPTIRELAEYIGNAETKVYKPVQPVEKKEYYVLSSAQKRLYVLQKMSPKSTAYNIPQVIRVTGEAVREKIEIAFKDLIRRHESLRTSFHLEGDRPVQIIHKDVEFVLTYYDSPNNVDSFVRPFDFERSPLLRAVLIRCGGEDYRLMVDMHHIISDGVSGRIMVEDFMALYRGEQLPPLSTRFRDFVEWRLHEDMKGNMKKHENYWINRFKKPVPGLEIPLDYPDNWGVSSDNKKSSFTINKEMTANLGKLAKETGTTLFVFLLAVYNILLSKYTLKEDIVVGVPVAGRRHTDLEHIIGMFVNMLVFRNYPVSGKSFSRFLDEVRDCSFQGFENQDYPFEELVARLGLLRESGRNPLVKTVLAVDNFDNFNQTLITADSGTEFRYEQDLYEEGGMGSKFDFILAARERQNQIECFFEYREKLFKQETIDRMGRHFLNILAEVIAHPNIRISEIRMTDKNEESQTMAPSDQREDTESDLGVDFEF